MRKYKFKEGETVFWRGKHYKAIGQMPGCLVLFSEKVDKNAAFIVPKREVEPLVSKLFKVGDKVRSRHWFRGRVTALEEESNRVICVSDYNDVHTGERTRWAYKPHELELIKDDEDDIPKFKVIPIKPFTV